MMITDLIGIIGAGLGIITNIYVLFISRVILGIGAGLNSAIVPLYIKEYTPLALTGSIGSLN